ncbi:SAM-dependent methyltransferase [Actinomadura rubrisoli]|uniref:SAM-dependent methyltransferase n=1 Tax=Actinomadura rubrisoli TaxID=2530368 RepID=UPI001FB69E7A|nr:SAM-dependent methyltransferase [Actinomadura rubrisoli]
MTAVLDLVRDEEDPEAAVAGFRDVMAPGSHLAVCDFPADALTAADRAAEGAGRGALGDGVPGQRVAVERGRGDRAGRAADRLGRALAGHALEHAAERGVGRAAHAGDLVDAVADAAGDGAADRAVQGRRAGLLQVDAVAVALRDLDALDDQVESAALEGAEGRALEDGAEEALAEALHQLLEDGSGRDLGRRLGGRDARRGRAEGRERRRDQEGDLDRRDDQQGDEHVLGVLDVERAAVHRLGELAARLGELGQHLRVGGDPLLPVLAELLGRAAVERAEDVGGGALELADQLVDAGAGVPPGVGAPAHGRLVALRPVGADDPGQPLDRIWDFEAHGSAHFSREASSAAL